MNAADLSGAPARSPWQDVRQALRRRPAVMASAALLLVVVLLCLLVPLFAPYAYDQLDLQSIAAPPGAAGMHLFGTDSVGRDLFVRTFHGGRMSLLVGFAGTLVSLAIGVAWGAVAGYFGGRVDQSMMRVVDILYALPFMFLVILLMVLFGRHLLLMFLAIGLINWLDMARVVRGQALALKRREFVDAARLAGLRDAEIIRRHIVPNLIGAVVVCATLTIPQVILVESFLSFLGLGVQEPATSWGALVNEGAADMEAAPWTLIFPAGFLALTLLCFNLVGDGLRDALDPKSR
ncbi:MAG: ABC transporter permease subunit [Gammaproteobacteria bacterium]|nr:ABC transporter permease subunit [Gammaproteobacteria bacterium]